MGVQKLSHEKIKWNPSKSIFKALQTLKKYIVHSTHTKPHALNHNILLKLCTVQPKRPATTYRSHPCMKVIQAHEQPQQSPGILFMSSNPVWELMIHIIYSMYGRGGRRGKTEIHTNGSLLHRIKISNSTSVQPTQREVFNTSFF